MPANVARKIAYVGTASAATIIAAVLGFGATFKGIVGDNDPCDIEFNFEPETLEQAA